MKHLKHILFCALLLASVLSFSQTVHYTRTGKKYHSEGCQYLRKSDYTCSLKEALAMGLDACSRCAPPTQVVEEKKAETPKKKITKPAKTGYLEHRYQPFRERVAAVNAA